MQSETVKVKEKRSADHRIDHENKIVMFTEEDLFPHIRTRLHFNQITIHDVLFPHNFIVKMHTYSWIKMHHGYVFMLTYKEQKRLLIFNK